MIKAGPTGEQEQKDLIVASLAQDIFTEKRESNHLTLLCAYFVPTHYKVHGVSWASRWIGTYVNVKSVLTECRFGGGVCGDLVNI